MISYRKWTDFRAQMDEVEGGLRALHACGFFAGVEEVRITNPNEPVNPSHCSGCPC